MSTTEQRLLTAAAEELFSSGYRGATTRAIAERAGVNEVTLFRRFGSKLELMKAAVTEIVAPFAGGIPEPSADVAADLESIASRYVAFVDSNPQIVARVLPEMAADPELAEIVTPIQAPVVRALASVIEHHQRAGRLVAEPPADALRAFLGPLAARAVMAHLLPRDPFDPGAHVRLYLTGRQQPTE